MAAVATVRSQGLAGPNKSPSAPDDPRQHQRTPGPMNKHVHSTNEQTFAEHLSGCQALLCLILSTTLDGGFHYSHLIDEETEAQPSEVILPASQSKEAVEPGGKVRHLALKHQPQGTRQDSCWVLRVPGRSRPRMTSHKGLKVNCGRIRTPMGSAAFINAPCDEAT